MCKFAKKYNDIVINNDIKKINDIEKILDDYQVFCQIKYNTGTVPDAREWFYNYKNKLV